MSALEKTKRAQPRSLLALGFVLAATASATKAANFDVTSAADSGAGSLRQAIMSANANSAAPHTINIAISAGSIELLSALPVITRSLSITAQTRKTIRFSVAPALAFSALGGGTFTMTNVNLQFTPVAPTTVSEGGCIRSVDNSGVNRWTMTISNATLTGCSAFSSSLAGRGGAIRANGPLTLRDSQIVDASAQGVGAQGGAIYSDANVTLERVQITGARAISSSSAELIRGGAVYLSNARLSAIDTTFENNQTNFNESLGGAIFLEQGSLILNRTAFFANSAGAGHAVAALGGQSNPFAVIENSSFVSNRGNSPSFPTALLLDNVELFMRHSAFHDNVSAFAHFGSTFGFSGNVFGSQSLNGCLFTAMPVGAIANFGSAACTAPGFLLADTRFAGFGKASASDLVPLIAFLPGSPIFDAYGGSGQSTSDFNQCALADARGQPRPRDDDGNGASNCDAGPGESVKDLPIFKDGFE